MNFNAGVRMAGNQNSKDKYLKEKVDTFVVRVPKGQKQVIQNFAKSKGMSLNSFVVELINKAVSEEENYG